MTKSEIKKFRKNNDLQNKKIVGIDVSSSVCGYAILEFNSNIVMVDYGYHEFDTSLDMYDRIVEFRKHITPKIQGGSYFVLEDRLKSFNGRTTAETLMKLAWVNAGVEIELKDMVGEDRVLKLHPMSARSCAWGQAYPKGEDKKLFPDTKDWIIHKSMEYFDIKPEDRGFEIKKRSPKNPKPFKDYVGDICDSITLAKALLN